MKRGAAASPPQYQLPPRDPLFDELKAQSDRDNINATRQSISADATSYAARFGFNSPVNFGGPLSPLDAAPAAPETKTDYFTSLVQSFIAKGQPLPAAFSLLAMGGGRGKG